MSLSEQGKQEFDGIYQVRKCDLLTKLHQLWGIPLDFEGNYLHDYKLLNNELTSERTAWTDKYTTALFSPFYSLDSKRKVLQPVPDICRWLKSNELHYMPWQEAACLEHGPWDEIPGLFLPSKILDLCFCTIPTPPSHIAQLITLLAWVPPEETKEYYFKLEAQVTSTLEADRHRELWKHHPLYKHKKEELEQMCRSLKISVPPSATNTNLSSKYLNSEVMQSHLVMLHTLDK